MTFLDLTGPGNVLNIRTSPRPIVQRCVECHATYFEVLKGGDMEHIPQGQPGTWHLLRDMPSAGERACCCDAERLHQP
jgi:hypothetical protein